MAHSVEGRFPFLDAEVMQLAASLPASYKLRVLDEKHVLKRASEGLVLDSILRRKKQPYRAPDAISFVSPGAPEFVREAFSDSSLARTHVFDPKMAGKLYQKCLSRAQGSAADGTFSNTDNMAFLGILSTQLVVDQLLSAPHGRRGRDIAFTTDIDRTTHNSEERRETLRAPGTPS